MLTIRLSVQIRGRSVRWLSLAQAQTAQAVELAAHGVTMASCIVEFVLTAMERTAMSPPLAKQVQSALSALQLRREGHAEGRAEARCQERPQKESRGQPGQRTIAR